MLSCDVCLVPFRPCTLGLFVRNFHDIGTSRCRIIRLHWGRSIAARCRRLWLCARCLRRLGFRRWCERFAHSWRCGVWRLWRCHWSWRGLLGFEHCFFEVFCSLVVSLLLRLEMEFGDLFVLLRHFRFLLLDCVPLLQVPPFEATVAEFDHSAIYLSDCCHIQGLYCFLGIVELHCGINKCDLCFL